MSSRKHPPCSNPLTLVLNAEKKENDEVENELNRLSKVARSSRERSKAEDKGKNFLEDGIFVTSPTDIEFSGHFQRKLEEWKGTESKMVSEMCCCAFCGHTDLRDKNVLKTNGFEVVPPAPRLLNLGLDA